MNFLADCYPISSLPPTLSSWLEEVCDAGLEPVAWHTDLCNRERVKLDCRPVGAGWVIPCSDGVAIAIRISNSGLGGTVRQECDTLAAAIEAVRS